MASIQPMDFEMYGYATMYTCQMTTDADSMAVSMLGVASMNARSVCAICAIVIAMGIYFRSISTAPL